MSETQRRVSNRDKVLAYLKDHHTVTNVDLNAICFRYGARILELRAEGYDIQTGEKRGGVVFYHYNGMRPTCPLRQPALFGEAA